ncbi:hypothetical protein H8711_07680 [Clostridiaceae bacterium NSJ-31]|uniref:Uncharacterized protein n=1 Tax=Ligaoa zhengdingensis TaxID=2763658 RepID=A0A926I4T5_9FIRM|nr:hypothetical protein [Ligaoa zhengdingensis]MBC8546813.1 hypothetical protein [Ligaoa zhengdingensis]
MNEKKKDGAGLGRYRLWGLFLWGRGCAKRLTTFFDKPLDFLEKIAYNKREAQKAQGRPGSRSFRALHMRDQLIHRGDSRALQPTLYNIFPPL